MKKQQNSNESDSSSIHSAAFEDESNISGNNNNNKESCQYLAQDEWKNDDDPEESKKPIRQQHKEAVKVLIQQKRAKKMGDAPELGRKPCDLCTKEVDLLVRCTIDESQQYKMVCGRCWPSVSGGVPDGISSDYPFYNYGGLWKNRNANLKKRIGSGSKKKSETSSSTSVLEEIAASVQAVEDDATI